jgi:hypothetical protein
MTVMHNWKLYPRELYALIITTPDFPAYQITGGTKIKRFVPPTQVEIEVEKIVPSLLFKHQDIVHIENKHDLDSNKEADDDVIGVRADTKKHSSKTVIKMINDASPEVERLYKAIKKIGFSGRKKVTHKQYKDAALGLFRECRNEFKLVKESYLSGPSLYTFRCGQQKGDFIGKLLLAIANDLALGINNYQELYKIYKSTKRLQ